MIFHLAIPVQDIESTTDFYQNKLGFEIGLSEEHRLIMNFFGHQVVAHVSPEHVPQKVSMYPRHFGVILDDEEAFQALLRKAKESGVSFFQDHMVRFGGTPRAHQTFFLKDPSNNLLEFKHYENADLLFSHANQGGTQ